MPMQGPWLPHLPPPSCNSKSSGPSMWGGAGQGGAARSLRVSTDAVPEPEGRLSVCQVPRAVTRTVTVIDENGARVLGRVVRCP